MVGNLICLEMSTKHSQTMQLQRGTNSESSSYSQQELRPRLRHTNGHSRIVATGMSSSFHTISMLATGYLFFMKVKDMLRKRGIHPEVAPSYSENAVILNQQLLEDEGIPLPMTELPNEHHQPQKRTKKQKL